VVGDFFPPAEDFPENLTRREFRSTYGGAGARPYREVVREIDRRIDLCPALRRH
jgi:hypothetical protein